MNFISRLKSTSLDATKCYNNAEHPLLLFSFIFLFDHFFQKAKIFINLTCAWCILAEIDLIDSTVQIYLVNTPIWFKTLCTYHCILMPLLLKSMRNVLAVIKTYEAAYCHKMVIENCSNIIICQKLLQSPNENCQSDD